MHSDDQRVDPVGACVGLRGQRVKNIVRELNNEKVDIIHWSPNIEEFVTEALKPAELREVEVHQERNAFRLGRRRPLSAIGKRGQNARLASRLTGWQIDIDAKEVETLSFDDQVADAVSALAALPGITDELAQTCISGFHSVEDLKQIEAGDLVGIPGLEENEATILTAANAEETTEEESAEEPLRRSLPRIRGSRRITPPDLCPFGSTK